MLRCVLPISLLIACASGRHERSSASRLHEHFALRSPMRRVSGSPASGTATKEPMADGADGAYTLDKDLAPGIYAYKFVVERATGEE